MRWGISICLLVLFAAPLAGCGQAPAAQLPCGALGGAPMLEYQLFFGRGSMSDQQWADFRANVVTVKLPRGFTELDTKGQWMNPSTGRISHESGKMILVIMPDTEASKNAVEGVKDDYLARFHQQSVGNIIFPVCGAF
jgi:hypothetical protein